MAPLSASSREASAPAPTTSVAGPAIYQQDTKQTASPSTIFSEFGGSISTRASPENCNNVLEQDEIDSNEEEERFESKNRKQIIMKSIGHEARISDYHTRPFTDLSKLGQISQQEASQLNENQHYMVSECVQGASSPTYSPYLEKLKTMGTSESRDYTEPPTADKGTRHQRHQNRTCTASEVSRSSNERVQTWNLGSNTTNCSSQNHQSLSNYSGSLSSDKTPSMNDSTARQQSIPLSSKSALSPSVSIPSTISSGYHGSSSTLYDRRQLNMQHKQCNVLGISNSQMNGRDDIVINGSTSKEPSAETILQLSDNHEEGSSGSQRDYRSEDRTPLQHINDITTSRTSSWDDSGGSIEVRSCEAGQADIRRLASSSYHIPQTSNPSSQISRSTVKSASPLRIVTTTPLPPPHLPSLIPPQVSSQTTKQQPESASSKQEEYKDMKIIDILTPNASPYSSLFTGRSSSIASSIPTTAASISYPTSATCQALNTEGIDDNALQLSQHRIDHWCSGKHDTSITEHEPATVSGRINIGSNKSSRRKSRYADFATPNIGEGRRADLGFSSHYGNRGWFHESCPHSRPPLLRSVSEDTPISHTLSKDPSPSTSPFGQVRYALPKGLENTSPHYEANLGYESLLMSSRALSTPSFISTNSSSALQASSSLYRNHNANAPHPPSETSSRNASNSISSSYSSTSTSITAASSKGSNWCSPETFSEKLPPRTSLTCLSDSSMTIKPANIHQSEINQKDCTSMNTPSKPRHSTSQSLGGSAAIPLFRTSQTPNQQSIKETKSRTSASPTSSTGGTSVKSTVDDQEVDINTDTLLASFDPDVAEAIRRAAAAVRNQSGNRTGPDVVRRDQVGGGGPVGHAQSGHGPSASSMSAMQNALMGACGNGYFGNAIRAKVSLHSI